MRLLKNRPVLPTEIGDNRGRYHLCECLHAEGTRGHAEESAPPLHRWLREVNTLQVRPPARRDRCSDAAEEINVFTRNLRLLGGYGSEDGPQQYRRARRQAVLQGHRGHPGRGQQDLGRHQDHPDLVQGCRGRHQAKPGARQQARRRQTYTVKAGDTLSKIAKELLGDANAYMRIFEANRDQLSDPDKIKPGQVLKIPAK